jgi:hypothetical protein
MDGAQSIASVLHSRLRRIPLSGLAGHDLTWSQRTPASAPAVAHELASALDVRARALGGQLTASPEPWLARHLGVLAPTASPALREEYARRAAAAAAYREAAGITDPHQAVSLLPHRSSPELENLRLAAIRALEIRDEADIARGMTRGELEARALEAERAQAGSPPDVSRQLRRIAQAEADAWCQHANAATRHDHTQAAHARTLSGQLAAERQRLEAASARYEKWSAATAVTRETAARARAELERRGISQEPAGPPQPQVVKQPEADGTDPSGGREDEVPVTPAASQEGPQREADHLEELPARVAAAVRRIAADHEGDRGQSPVRRAHRP